MSALRTMARMPLDPTRTGSSAALLAAAALLAGASLSGCSRGDDPAPAPAPAGGRSAYLRSLPIHVDGEKVDLGRILPCTREVTRTVQVRNTSKNPVEVLGYSSNCGCMGATLKGSRTIGPGESRDLELVVHPLGYGQKSLRVEFGAAGGLAGIVRVDYDLSGAVHPVPAMHDHVRGGKEEALDFELVSEDGKAFRVLSLDPPVGEIVRAQGPRALVRVSTFEVDQFAASPMGARHPGIDRAPDGKVRTATVKVTTDDPACPVTEVSVNFGP